MSSGIENNGPIPEKMSEFYFGNSRFALELIARVQEDESISGDTLCDLLAARGFLKKDGDAIESIRDLIDPKKIGKFRSLEAKKHIAELQKKFPLALTKNEQDEISALLLGAKKSRHTGVAKRINLKPSVNPVASQVDAISPPIHLTEPTEGIPAPPHRLRTWKDPNLFPATKREKAERRRPWAERKEGWLLIRAGTKAGLTLEMLGAWLGSPELKYTTDKGVKVNSKTIVEFFQRAKVDTNSSSEIINEANRRLAKFQGTPASELGEERKVAKLLEARIAFLKERGISLTPLP